MLVVREQISKLGLVQPECQIELKNSTCDLTVGEIFPNGDDRPACGYQQDTFWLEPNHMVSVLTTQRLKLPANVTGLATLVTSLTQDGLLCLNVGIIDPGYSGQLSATLVNFSNKSRKITLGDRLFRIVFLKHRTLREDEIEPFENSKQSYRKRLDDKSRNEFSETFLDVKGMENIAKTNAWSIVWVSVLTNVVPWLALLVGLIGVGVAVIALQSS